MEILGNQFAIFNHLWFNHDALELDDPTDAIVVDGLLEAHLQLAAFTAINGRCVATAEASHRNHLTGLAGLEYLQEVRVAGRTRAQIEHLGDIDRERVEEFT